MKLVYFRGHVPNFGDELNPWLWPRLLPPGLLDDDAGELFVGIGSILTDRLPGTPVKHVMGSGFAGYTSAPDVHDGSWRIGFVRGPRTARGLGLPREKAVCDSAILLRALDLPAPAAAVEIAFMPHYESLDRGFWIEACRLAGIHLVDPRLDVEQVIAELRGTRMLITEAMHGAIVADALRTPWVAARPINARHHAKWLDWAEALGIALRQHALWPSSMMEAYVAATGGRGQVDGRAGRVGRSAAARPANAVLTRLAAMRLTRLARVEPQLSGDGPIAEATERALAAVDAFARNHRARGPLRRARG